MQKSRVLAVILADHRTTESSRTIGAALAALSGFEGGVTVVGSGSRDGAARAIRGAISAQGWQDRVRFVNPVGPAARAARINIGISAGLPDGQVPDYICLLGPGALPAPDAIRALVAHLDAHPGTGIVGGALHGPDGASMANAFRFPSLLSEFRAGARRITTSRAQYRVAGQVAPAASGPVDWVGAGAMMLRRRALDDIGLFDEDYREAFADTDLCRRARAAGWATDHVRESRVDLPAPLGGDKAIRQRAQQDWMDARLRYFRLHHGRLFAGLATLARLAGAVVGGLKCSRTRAEVPGFLPALVLRDVSAARNGLWRMLRGATAPSAPQRSAVPATRRARRR